MSRKRKTSAFGLQMWRYGFFADQIPPCFSSARFAERYDDLKSSVSKSCATSPANLSIYKSKTSRRIVSAANPYAFACTVKFMEQHRAEIFIYASSPNSESPITFIHSYHGCDDEVINSDLARLDLWARSDFIHNLRKRIAFAMGYRYQLKLDVANFYNSIYTHSIAWAICGKKEAKRIFSSEEKAVRTQKYNFADELDKKIRDQKNQETNGILTGPFTSRIFSELLMASIDRELDKAGFRFKRYVDDYKFYFRSEHEARQAIIDVSKVLNEFNLIVNQSKVEIVEYPFDLESGIKDRLDSAFDRAGIYGALTEAGQLYARGEKGVYKYALKMLRDRVIPNADRQQIISMLFNINLVDPKYARYIVPFLEQSREALGDDELSKIVNDELERALAERFEQEVLNLLFFIRKLELNVRGQLLLDSLYLENDFIDILALDLWVKCGDRVVRSVGEARKINKAVDDLEKEMQVQSMDGEHWLLLYEASVHGLLEVDIEKGKTSAFFKKMKERGVSFYCIE